MRRFKLNRKLMTVTLSILMLLVFSLSIGYAALSTTLNILGDAEVTASNWNVYLANPEIKEGSISDTLPSIVGNTTANFSVTLSKPGDFYEFTIDVVNDGDIDAMIESVSKTSLSETHAKYLNFVVEYENGDSILEKQLLSAGKYVRLKVKLLFRTDLNASDLPSTSEILSLSFTVNYVQSDGSGINVDENNIIEPGYYENGVMVMSWDELLENTELSVMEDGTLTSDNGVGTSSSSRTKIRALTGEIVVSDDVTKIGDFTFYGKYDDQTNLSGISFGKNSKLESIGDYAFGHCTKLERIEIPASVTIIGNYSFYGQASSQMILGEVLFGAGSKLKTIGNNAFSWCTQLKSIVIPKSVTSIGSDAFSFNTALSSFVFEDDVQIETINQFTFFGCIGLKSIEIPASVKTIDKSAFSGSIETYQDDYIMGLERVIFEEGSQLQTIGKSAFSICSNLKSIEIPASVVSIGEYAFSGYYDFYTKEPVEINLEHLTFEEGSHLETIGSCAFKNCIKLVSVEIPKSVTTIDGNAFEKCVSLESITFEENSSLKTISGSSFRYTKISTITIPSSVTRIGSFVFYNCDNLTTIIFEDSDSTWFVDGVGSISLSTPSGNATLFKSTYYSKFWSKE